MPKHRAIARPAERPPLRKLVTTIIVILMTVLIVRDILVPLDRATLGARCGAKASLSQPNPGRLQERPKSP